VNQLTNQDSAIFLSFLINLTYWLPKLFDWSTLFLENRKKKSKKRVSKNFSRHFSIPSIFFLEIFLVFWNFHFNFLLFQFLLTKQGSFHQKLFFFATKKLGKVWREAQSDTPKKQTLKTTKTRKNQEKKIEKTWRLL